MQGTPLTEAGKRLAALIDHTLLKPDARRDQVLRLCEEAARFGFAAVCVNPWMLASAVSALRGHPVKPCTVVGFPLGATTAEVKGFEAADAVKRGAAELDMVLNVSALKDGDRAAVRRDIEAVVRAAEGRIVKVILETCLLTDDEKRDACRLAVEAGARFVKTSTGLAGGGATVEDIRLMRAVVGPNIGVKASGGIRTSDDARRMVEAGATRIGTSAGVAIVTAAQLPGGAGGTKP
jgi:deoxyribose-phosphate aldolase